MTVPRDTERSGAVEIPAMRLDDLVAEHGLDVIELCKIDVAGHEVEVLRGGSATLPNIQRLIIERHGRGNRRQVLAAIEPSFSTAIDDADIGLVFAVNRCVAAGAS